MIRIEKEIYDSIQHIEDIIDNIKADLEFIFDNNVDESKRFDAKEACNVLISKDLDTEVLAVKENINEYWINKEDFKEV